MSLAELTSVLKVPILESKNRLPWLLALKPIGGYHSKHLWAASPFLFLQRAFIAVVAFRLVFFLHLIQHLNCTVLIVHTLTLL